MIILRKYPEEQKEFSITFRNISIGFKERNKKLYQKTKKRYSE